MFSFRLAGQEESGWRISQKNINIQAGDDRLLQLLDESAQEIHGAEWSVDDSAVADVREENGRAVVHAKAPGTVRIRATLHGEKRFREIKIWPQDQPMPMGTTTWGTHPIGREIGDISAVPTPDGPSIFSLEQTANGKTYLRGVRDDGIQIWNWLMPETTRDVDLVCGDWLGGALISANRSDSYTLYTVGNDGKLRWQHTLPGIRKAHAYNRDRMPGRANYLLGRDVRASYDLYGRVRWHGVYSGIDLVFRGNQEHLEYDFEVGAGRDPGRIKLGRSEEHTSE